MMKFSKLSGTSEAGAFRDVYGQRRNSPGQIELESFADPMRKEVTLVRKKIDSLDKELKPLGNTVQKKETEYKDALEAFNEKNKEKVELITKLQESSLPHEEAVVFVVSTTGQGDSPDSFKNSKSTL